MTRGPSVSTRDAEFIVSLLCIQPLTRAQLLIAWHEEHDSGDSAMRCAIEAARALGYPVIWREKKYRLAASWQELSDWIAREAEPRARRLEEQMRRMRERAIEFFPPVQGTLIAA